MISGNRRAARRVALAIAVLAMIGASGCLVGPNYRPPVTKLPARWEGAGELRAARPSPAAQTQATEASLATWWRAFDDPVLERLIEQALSSNLDLKLAAERVREARAYSAMTAAQLYPTLGSAWSYTQQRYSENTPFGSFPQVFPPEYNLYSGAFDSSWEIDLFGGVRRSVEAAQAQVQAARENLRDVRVSLLAEVARDYVDVRVLERRIEIVQSNVRDQQSSLALTRDRFQMGFAPEVDVSQAKSLLLATETQIPTLHTQLMQSIHRLGVLLGEEPNALRTELLHAAPIPGAADPDAIAVRIPVGLPSDLLRRRPDIRAAERELAAATAQVGVATAAFYPSFSLTGTVGLQSLGVTDFLAGASRFWTVGPTLNLPIFEGGLLRANLAAQNAKQRQAFYTWRKAVLGALEEVDDRLTAYAEERSRHALLLADVAAYRRSADMAQDRYIHGFGSYLAVLDARRSLYDAEDQRVQSDQNLVIDLIAIYKALGGGWRLPSAGA